MAFRTWLYYKAEEKRQGTRGYPKYWDPLVGAMAAWGRHIKPYKLKERREGGLRLPPTGQCQDFGGLNPTQLCSQKRLGLAWGAPPKPSATVGLGNVCRVRGGSPQPPLQPNPYSSSKLGVKAV